MNVYEVTFCDENGAFSLKLPPYLCFNLGSIVEWHNSDYLIISIDYTCKKIIAKEVNLIQTV